MDFDSFRELYQRDIQVVFDWTLAAASGLRVQTKTVALNEGSRFLVPWYRKDDGSASHVGDPSSRPLNAVQVANDLAFCERKQIQSDYTGPVPLRVPAYDIGEDRYLLLDGNHRVCAALRSAKNYDVILDILMGPLSGEICRDLARW